MVSAPGRLLRRQRKEQGEQSEQGKQGKREGDPQERRRAWTGWTKDRWRTILLPLEHGSRDMRSLDGLRALAALMVVVFHLLLWVDAYDTPVSRAINASWYFLANGVWLFFVLSGFLLFLPYARTTLAARPLPSATYFYRRRMLRIVPAYWVCLFIVAVAENQLRRTVEPLNMLTHVLMIHDDFPRFNRDLEPPFWTLAVEAQFYLVLPLLAWGIARVVGASRSLARVVLGIVAVILLALTVQWVDSLVMSTLPDVDGVDRTPGGVFVLATMGMQGKFLAVFAVGMLCAALYVVVIEQGRVSKAVARRCGKAALLFALVMFAIAIPAWAKGAVMFHPGTFWGLDIQGYPLISAAAFGGLLLALLLGVSGGGRLGRVFAWGPLRFVGLISFSLYLWHLPILQGLMPPFDHLALPLRLLCIPIVAYASYQLIERPFLARRHTTSGKE
ncbi:MAG TPA: acyltransferase [Ktedonobacterales bacterium]|nr:acyltransferase [Ktedonobacterales bacterium]